MGKSHSLTVKRKLAAPPNRVFEAWTTPELLCRWCAPAAMSVPHAEVELRVGGAYAITMREVDETYTTTGHYRELVAGERLVLTWGWDDGPGREETLVTVTLATGASGGTDLTLTHDGFPDASEAALHEKGWRECLEKLAGLAGDLARG
ncbi:MAG: SRPBCC domain-containing protein [Deltaproteobacteria bacterium]|nr:SRPBCC domain-containing protein [Deltaproteobacteria bacterium]